MSKSQCKSVLWVMLVVAGSLHAVCAQTASPEQRGLQSSDPAPSASLPTGQYYALVIGNQNYKGLPQLQTPVNDANEIAQMLRDRYRFQAKVLLDATRDQILTALTEYRRTLPENSSLLIYYAGHGFHDRDTDEAYWLPVDAEPDNNANWISANDITSDVRAIPSAHVLIISDSCYSGYIVASRSGNVGINPDEMRSFLKKMLASKSRNLMSSGGDEPVADAGAPGHSVFAAAVLDSLRRIDQTDFTAADLFLQYIQPAVGGRSPQLPQYSAIRNSGHQYGDFVFSRQLPPQEPQQPQQALKHREPQTFSANRAKAIIVEHGFFDARWNQAGGTMAHQYKVTAGGDFLMVLDPGTGLMWERGGSGQLKGYKEAKAYVDALNAAKSGGFDDWRLPTLEEAMSLMTSPDRGQGGEVLMGSDTRKVVYHIDKSFEASGAYFMWTADLESPTRAWVVYFMEGYCSPEELDRSAYVRAARTNR